MAWPEIQLKGTHRAWNLDYYLHLRGRTPEMVQPGQPMLMGFVIPPFQRPLVWDEERMIRFVESAILRLHLGTIVYNNGMELPDAKIDGKTYFNRTHLWLIDGQQRLTALDRFFDDAFPVFGLYWSEVDPVKKALFLMQTPLEGVETSMQNIDELKELYNRMNFGGVAHTEEQRAALDDDDAVPSGPGL